mmetsp:Transcript_19740/g.40274  ORF Transcript_19740/g.40274 Transcript_19740/m.40274 type:complete len:752 (+) Transcript_19740:157-2412(+)
MHSACTKMQESWKFLDTLGLNQCFFNHSEDKCYCERCGSHIPKTIHLGDGLFEILGTKGGVYEIPHGWCGFGLTLPPRHQALNIFQEWSVSFHGCPASSVSSILDHGSLRKPGDVLLDGQNLANRATGGEKHRQKIYTSPSILYAGIYTSPLAFEGSNVRIVLQCRQKTMNSDLLVEGETIGWESRFPGVQVSPHFCNSELEWSTNAGDSVIPYRILVNIGSLTRVEVEEEKKKQMERNCLIAKVRDQLCSVISPQWGSATVSPDTNFTNLSGTCRNGHNLCTTFSRPEIWRCDGICQRLFRGQSFRCDECDFDVCNTCLAAMNNLYPVIPSSSNFLLANAQDQCCTAAISQGGSATVPPVIYMPGPCRNGHSLCFMFGRPEPWRCDGHCLGLFRGPCFRCDKCNFNLCNNCVAVAVPNNSNSVISQQNGEAHSSQRFCAGEATARHRELRQLLEHIPKPTTEEFREMEPISEEFMLFQSQLDRFDIIIETLVSDLTPKLHSQEVQLAACTAFGFLLRSPVICQKCIDCNGVSALVGMLQQHEDCTEIQFHAMRALTNLSASKNVHDCPNTGQKFLEAFTSQGGVQLTLAAAQRSNEAGVQEFALCLMANWLSFTAKGQRKLLIRCGLTDSNISKVVEAAAKLLKLPAWHASVERSLRQIFHQLVYEVRGYDTHANNKRAWYMVKLFYESLDAFEEDLCAASDKLKLEKCGFIISSAFGEDVPRGERDKVLEATIDQVVQWLCQGRNTTRV